MQLTCFLKVDVSFVEDKERVTKNERKRDGAGEGEREKECLADDFDVRKSSLYGYGFFLNVINTKHCFSKHNV